MAIELRNSTQADIDYIQNNPLEDIVKSYPPLTACGFCKTVLVDGKIAGVGGVVAYWPGMGECWVILSKDIKTKIIAVRAMRKIINEAISELELVRLQCTCAAGFKKAEELIRHLGFTQEAYMPKYLPTGGDAKLFSRIVK